MNAAPATTKRKCLSPKKGSGITRSCASRPAIITMTTASELNVAVEGLIKDARRKA